MPPNIVKIDIVTEPNTTLTLEELVARQKQIIADSNGQIQLEEATTLSSGPPAVRMLVSGFASFAGGEVEQKLEKEFKVLKSLA